MSQILVIGSSNTDMVVKTESFPLPGETVMGGTFLMSAGGKGANQAVASARLNGKVRFICKLGTDIFGDAALEGLQKEGIDCRYILRDPEVRSGVALITVDKSGQNSIVVAPGANDSLNEKDLEHAEEAFRDADIILLQLEIPMPTVLKAVNLGFREGKKIVLNPAPAKDVPEDIWPKLHLVTPNETELSRYTGMDVEDDLQAREAALTMLEKGVKNVLVTLGSRGALLVSRELEYRIPAFHVEAKDTTAAGDVFNGALCVGLAEGMDWTEAMDFASKAAAISVTRMGAQTSAPTRLETESFKTP
jgi:ribokinase